MEPKPKKLIYPQEIEVWYVLPAIRKKIAVKLVERGLSQKKVAEIMGVTEAAVSQYKKQKRAKREIFTLKLEIELEKTADRIIKDGKELSKEVIRLNELFKRSGTICKAFKDLCVLKDKKDDCPYCLKD